MPGGASAAPRSSLRVPAALSRGREDVLAVTGTRELAGSVYDPFSPTSYTWCRWAHSIYKTRTRLQLLRKISAEMSSGFPWILLPAVRREQS